RSEPISPAPPSHTHFDSIEGPLTKATPDALTNSAQASNEIHWTPDAEKELGKIPFFVRKKARKNTEAFAVMQGISAITKDTLYEAKAHYGR
ncbi:MAG: ferredoxin:protochlorophyllide reductase (ATP-dependent) subunit B, partial [Burkholderiaceae bacterium]